MVVTYRAVTSRVVTYRVVTITSRGSHIQGCHIQGNQIFFIFSSHEYTDSPADSPDVIVVIDSFKSKIIKMKVIKLG